MVRTCLSWTAAMTIFTTARAETVTAIFQDLLQNRTVPWIKEVKRIRIKTEVAWVTPLHIRWLKTWSSISTSSYWILSRARASISDKTSVTCTWRRPVILPPVTSLTVLLNIISKIRLFKDHCRAAKHDQPIISNIRITLATLGTFKKINLFNNWTTNPWTGRRVLLMTKTIRWGRRLMIRRILTSIWAILAAETTIRGQLFRSRPCLSTRWEPAW